MPELSLTLTELAKECKRLGSLADRAEDNELRARKVQTQVDALRSEEGDLRGNIEIRKQIEESFPEVARREFNSLPNFKPSPSEVAVAVEIFEDFDDLNSFSDLQERVETIIVGLRDFRISSRTRDIWNTHLRDTVSRLSQEIRQVESLQPEKVNELQTRIREFNVSGKVLSGENVRKLADLVSEVDTLRDNLDRYPEKVKKFLNLLSPDQKGAPINALENPDVAAWIKENNFAKSLVIRMKDR